MKSIRARPHRLTRERYRGYVSVSFTACIEPRKPFFTTAKRVGIFVETLSIAVCRYSCNIVYCFMPDHVHLVVSGKSSVSDTLMVMETFKQQTGWWLKENERFTEWQQNFHDRIIRNTAEYAETIRYVVNNPVRAGLVDWWEDYPFTGAIGLNLREHLIDMLPY